MCGTPVQAIWDHKNLTELAGGVREGQNLPQNGLTLALEPSRGPQIGSVILILTKFGILISTWFQIVPFGL